MTAVIQMQPQGHYAPIELDRFLIELEARFRQKEVMRRKEAAAFLGISVRQLDDLSVKGSVPYHRIEGLSGKLYLRSELIELVRRG